MNDYNFSLDELIARLRDNVSTALLFIKVDGTERTMNATLNKEFIEDKFGPEDLDRILSDSTILNGERLHVFDVDLEDWRSFYLWNLIEAEGVQFNNEVPA